MDLTMKKLIAISIASASIGLFQHTALMAFPFSPKDSECQWLRKDGTHVGTLYECQVEYDSSGFIIYMKWDDGEASAIGRTAGWRRVGENCFYHQQDGDNYRICDQRYSDSTDLREASLCLDFLRQGHPLKQRKPVIERAYIETIEGDLTKKQFSKRVNDDIESAKERLRPYVDDNTFHIFCSMRLKSAWDLVYKYTGIDYRKN